MDDQLPYWMQVAGFYAAAIGAPLGIASFFWNVYSWRRSGPSVSAEILLGPVLRGSAAGIFGLSIEKPIPIDAPIFHDSGSPTQLAVAVKVENSGRQAVTVQSCAVEIGWGARLEPDFTILGSVTLPARLEANDTKVFAFPAIHLHAAVKTFLSGTHGTQVDVIAVATLGGGKVVRSSPLFFDASSRRDEFETS